jgi:hypothetical protein
MLKAITEPSWLEGQAHETNRISAVSIIGWLKKAVRAMRYFDLPDKNRRGVREGIIAHCGNKDRSERQHIKDDFFHHRGYVGCRRIPEKTWKRHSAFLVYREEACRQEGYSQAAGNQRPHDRHTAGKYVTYYDSPVAAVVDSKPGRLTSDKPDNAGKSVRIKVKSLRYLPVWAAALYDLSLIEIDINTNTYTSTYTLSPVNAVKPVSKIAAAV